MSTSSLGLSLIVRSLLTASGTLTAIVPSTKIFPKEAPDDTALPILVYSVDIGEAGSGTAQVVPVTVEINVYSHTDSQAQSIAEAVDAVLNEGGGRDASGAHIYPLSRGSWQEDRDFDNNEWIRQLRYIGNAYV